MSPQLQPGHTFDWTYTVPPRATVPQLYADTAFCRDMPDVLATGYMVGMMELACIAGIMPFMDWPREQSVGTMVSFRHLAATPPGLTLAVKGKVTAVEGRRIQFEIDAWDGIDKICEGTHERTVIDAARFSDKIARKAGVAA
ncbi:MAG TPA: thioesterase family protein [Burkholderiaceae bacterium]